MTEQEQAKARAEEAEEKANRASEEAASASDMADESNKRIDSKKAHWKAAQANDRAAHANRIASMAHQAHADTGGEDAAGSAAEYADSPSEAARACMTEVERFEAEAAWHREQAGTILTGEAGEGALGALLALAMVAVGGAAVVFVFGPIVQTMLQGLMAGLAF